MYLIMRDRIKSKKQKRRMKGRTEHKREPREGNIKLNNLGIARTKLKICDLRLHAFNYLESRKKKGV
jgi:hypothetical protein